jgi:pyruvate dehydrogenase E2 component (dihydrolipoamide acetyltransferase)
MPLLVKMPKWGLMMKAGTVTEWLRGEGDTVTAGEPLFVVETEKAINDVAAPGDGILRRIVAGQGSVVAVSGPVAVIAVGGETLSDEAVDAFVASQSGASATGTASGGGVRQAREPQAATRDDEGRVAASPAARRRARELGIDLAGVAATGPGGRITSEDVERAAAQDGASEQLVAIDGDIRILAISAGPSSAPALVFIHGIGGSSTTWEGVIDAFAAVHRVVALDLPGHGRSDVPDPDRFAYDLDALARAVLTALHALGISGAAVAITAALEAPDRIDRLVLVDAAGLGPEVDPRLLELLSADPSEAASRALLELFFEDRSLVLDAGVSDHLAGLQRPGAHDAIRAIAASALTKSGQRPIPDADLGRITQPVLVVWGERDRVFPASQATRIEGAEVAVIPGAGHAPQVEAPAAFTEAVGAFLEEPDP